jgi:hypothetical protein
MSDHNDLKITPISLKSFTCKQSKHSTVPSLPLRGVILAPSGSGKTVLLANLILKVCRGCFERIYVFSPSVNVDQTWEAVKTYQADVMKVKESDDEKLYFDHYTVEDLKKIIDTQARFILHMKSKAHPPLFCVGDRRRSRRRPPLLSTLETAALAFRERQTQQHKHHRLDTEIHGSRPHHSSQHYLLMRISPSKHEGPRNLPRGVDRPSAP